MVAEEGLFCHQQGSDQRTHHQHSQAHPWSGFQEVCPLGTQGDPEICRGVRWELQMDTRLNKAVWTKRKRNVPYHIGVQLLRTCKEDEDLPNELYILVGYVGNCHHCQKSTDS
ncbi:unnamed protein product [Gulo gulo]|uniref:Uncharacterized protein n=1 Tax=Gulo gulo TaxID=48420 RepID=A0A9X9PUX8_GULGU|nr:unnamed protein product [Gulo gulo]